MARDALGGAKRWIPATVLGLAAAAMLLHGPIAQKNYRVSAFPAP
jgi:hypothetical protein